MTDQLDPGLVQLVAHIASTAAGCRYCQAHTGAHAARAGVAEEKLAAAWEFETSDLFDAAERAALRLARDAAILPNAATPRTSRSCADTTRSVRSSTWWRSSASSAS